MADEAINTNTTKVISKKNSGFPDYLDFDKLRTDSISYLGELSGKLWTDHNVHDPGITILESLIYAILDLGYRTNLPTEDILARDPEDKFPDDNFFTPAQILTCNPLTITDYRKLLVDIEGVKNAWLSVAENITIDGICGTNNSTTEQPPTFNEAGVLVPEEEEPDCCISYLNGLYHVYLDIEHKFPGDKDQQIIFQECVVEKVKRSLMSHRNLCEDFIDINVLCRFETGVCADIELEPAADAEKIYIKLVETLRDFFSPSPRFYTLQQLLAKKIPIEEIFAGRPYDTGESHGFVDTKEFEATRLKKEIHLSDVYAAILTVSGIKSVRNLKLRKCNDTGTPVDITDWKLSLPENHVPEFSINCSGFHFSRNGTTVFVDFNKFTPYFNLNFSNNGKIMYPALSPYLDAAIKYGIYRSDLSGYLSVQNEFPIVYGIGEGQLPSDVKVKRKAQALQLKGYLLFFDQLLANYLSQLTNIRTLFSFSTTLPEKKHTYFINKLESVPELNKLLRFKTEEGDQNFLGTGGTALAFPVEKNKLQEKIDSGKIKDIDPGKDLRAYTFATIAECKTAMNLLRTDLGNGIYKPQVVAAANDLFFFYFFTSSEKIAIVSKKFYTDEKQALRAAASIQFLATLEENYRRYIDTCTDDFSFDIEFNLSGYISNLQTIIETGDEFNRRRNVFLDHLLARFSERFTDYALLSFRLDPATLLNNSIKAKEKYLANYPDLSSNRGKAYDYSTDGWNNDNISGFEKRFKALAGIENWQRHSLCNFVVEAEEEEFIVSIPYAENKTFNCVKVFDKNMAIRSAQSLLGVLADEPYFSATEIPVTGSFEIYTRDEYNNRYSSGNFANEKLAEEYAIYMNKLFRFTTSEKDVFESSYLYYLHLRQKVDTGILRTYRTPFTDKKEIQDILTKSFKAINEEASWQELQPVDANEEKRDLVPDKDRPAEYINVQAFKIDINDTIEEKPGLFNYEVLDKKYHKFKLRSVNEFLTREEAENDCRQLLFLLTDPASYTVGKDEDSGKPFIQVTHNGVAIARSEIFKSPDIVHKKISEIRAIADQHRYILDYDTRPHKWKFSYRLTAPDKDYFFESRNEYDDKNLALTQARLFSAALPELIFDEKKRELATPGKTKTTTVPVAALREEIIDIENTDEANKRIASALENKKTVQAISSNQDPATAETYLHKTVRSQNGDYVYRLVDKDNLLAVYTGEEINIDCNDDKQKRAVFNQLSSQNISWLEISQGSDIICEEKDTETGILWFHYQVKCLNRFDADGKELILFESVRGYPDAGEATSAFREEYLSVMQKALEPESYGTFISLEKIMVHTTGFCVNTESKVFIPRKTLDETGSYDADAVRKIIALVHQFPLRSVALNSEEFYKIFHCADEVAREKAYRDKCVNITPSACNCNDKETVQTVYYFVIESWADGVIKRQWQSMTWYATATEAMQRFGFFILLQSNRINYTVSGITCDCSCKVYIREVLAQSASRFPDTATAWGPTGIERFICIAQATNAFHTYFNNANCCSSFYVACGNAHAVHPCIYDTPEKRDHALSSLVRSAAEFAKLTLPGIFLSNDQQIIYDANKNPIANFIDPWIGQKQIDFCEKLFYLWEFMIKKCNYGLGTDNKPFLKNDQDQVIATAINEISLSIFRDKLQEAAYYFPLVKTKEGSDIQYCVEIKFPPSLQPVSKKPVRSDCGCEDDPDKPADPSCYIAWKSSCCYTTCRLAFMQYLEILELLKDPVNYHPVFDCVCNSYAIRLHTVQDVVAFNPQCYDTADKACDAVLRSKRLINSEGLHVVEHILLRPHCEAECECLINSNIQCDETKCDNFRWSEGETVDPCEAGEDICFIPGADPYSFIATVALPAWPERFRDKESRELVERMLYREAPAHVMLRILWLAPHDLCCFEGHFKKWSRYLADKNTCDENYNTCTLLRFLFNSNYECLPECDECECADSERIIQEPCFIEQVDQVNECNQFLFLNQVNEYFCWTQVDCCNYQFQECGEFIRDNATMVMDAIPDTATVPATAALVERTALPMITDEDWLASKERADLINNRNTKYRNAVQEIVVATEEHENPIPPKAKSFLRKPAPKFSDLEKLVDEAIGNKIPGSKKLSKKQSQTIVENILLYYLDRIWFNGNDQEERESLLKLLKQHEKKLELKKIYTDWNVKEVIVIQPGSDINIVKKAMTGRK